MKTPGQTGQKDGQKDGWKDRQRDGQKDRQTLFHRTLPATAGGVQYTFVIDWYFRDFLPSVKGC